MCALLRSSSHLHDPIRYLGTVGSTKTCAWTLEWAAPRMPSVLGLVQPMSLGWYRAARSRPAWELGLNPQRAFSTC